MIKEQVENVICRIIPVRPFRDSGLNDYNNALLLQAAVSGRLNAKSDFTQLCLGKNAYLHEFSWISVKYSGNGSYY